MSTPKRIQRQRSKGWRMPEGAIYVGRPSRWGNPFVVGDDPQNAVDLFDDLLRRAPVGDGTWGRRGESIYETIRRELGGRDLACWCPLDQPCHADTLLEIASSGTLTAERVADVLGGYAFGYASEDQLQSGIASALTAAGWSPEREVRFGDRDRVDVLVDGVAIEVKLAGTADQLLRQLRRYSVWPEVRELLVVTTLSRHQVMPPEINGRPCRVLHIGGVR